MDKIHNIDNLLITRKLSRYWFNNIITVLFLLLCYIICIQTKTVCSTIHFFCNTSAILEALDTSLFLISIQEIIDIIIMMVINDKNMIRIDNPLENKV